MEELFKALHDGGEGSLFSEECADGFVHVKCGEELFELDRIGIPIQRRFDVWLGRDEEIRVVRTHLVVLGVEYNSVPGNPDCIRNQSFFPRAKPRRKPRRGCHRCRRLRSTPRHKEGLLPGR